MTRGGVAGFADARGLECDESGAVRQVTPILSDEAEAGPIARGELADGLRGELFAISSTPGKEATAILTRVPEVLAYTSTVACHDREAGVAVPAKYATEEWSEIRLESIGFEERYRLLVLGGQDEGWILELFSPGLVDWLMSEAPTGLSFELNEGWLCAFVAGAPADAEALASLCEDAAGLAGRIRAEALEEGSDPDLFDAAENTRRMDAAVAEVEWPQPPASVRDAVAAYVKAAERKPRVLAMSALTALSGLIAGGAFGWLFGGPFGALAAGAFGFLGGFSISRPLLAGRYRFEGGISIEWAAIQAFNREYAGSRGLERQKLFRFHHDHRDLPVPGKAESVQAGEVPGTGLAGLFVMLSDSAELRASGGDTMTPAQGRPGSYDAMVVDLPGPVEEEEIAAIDLPDGYSAALAGRQTVVVWRPIPGNLTRTAEGCDEFRLRAGEAIAHLSA